MRPRYAHLARLVDATGCVIDESLAIFFESPASATGEDVLELHTHGSPLVAELVLHAAITAGARLAQPGEFTKRAFLAGKIDLSAAEAVADLIDAEHHSAARAAAGRLAGGIAHDIQTQRRAIQVLLEELAASIDFPDEVEEVPRAILIDGLTKIRSAVAAIVAGGAYGRLVREGATVAIVGPPNAGKSSLLNALLGDDRALVSPIAGTTRDTIEEHFDCDGVLLRLIDTAGLHEGADDLERAGIDRSRRILDTARMLLVVIDGSQQMSVLAKAVMNETAARPRVVLLNKADLAVRIAAADLPPDTISISGSIHDKATLQSLRTAVRSQLVDAAADLERPFLSRAREVNAAVEALSALDFALQTVGAQEPLDLVSGDLVAASAALGKITGDTVTEETLTGIFARFCIGK